MIAPARWCSTRRSMTKPAPIVSKQKVSSVAIQGNSANSAAQSPGFKDAAARSNVTDQLHRRASWAGISRDFDWRRARALLLSARPK